MAARPISSRLSVSLLIKRGMIVLDEIKLRANQKTVPSSRLTVRFQR